jgi:uncharacterized coiled-coil DUF342 family protein
MTTESLNSIGVTDKELQQKLFAEYGKGIEAFKKSVTALTTERDGLKDQLTQANKQIEAFKALDVEGVKKAADEWKTKYEEAQKEADRQLMEVKFDAALSAALTSAKARNSKAAAALLQWGLHLPADIEQRRH